MSNSIPLFLNQYNNVAQTISHDNKPYKLLFLCIYVALMNVDPHRTSRMTQSAISYNKIGLSRLIHITFSVGIVPGCVTLIRLF